jgi:hypothetical protein
MAYTDESERFQQKTNRIGILCATIAFLGFLWAMTRTSDCNPPPPGMCHDTFHVVDDRTSTYDCPPGSRGEMIMSPPAPKPGVLCHCINNSDPPVEHPATR